MTDLISAILTAALLSQGNCTGTENLADSGARYKLPQGLPLDTASRQCVLHVPEEKNFIRPDFSPAFDYESFFSFDYDYDPNATPEPEPLEFPPLWISGLYIIMSRSLKRAERTFPLIDYPGKLYLTNMTFVSVGAPQRAVAVDGRGLYDARVYIAGATAVQEKCRF